MAPEGASAADAAHGALHRTIVDRIVDTRRILPELRAFGFPVERLRPRLLLVKQLLEAHRCHEVAQALDDLYAMLVGYVTLVEDGWGSQDDLRRP